MALFDKLQNIELPAHEFSAALHFWAIGDVTRTNVINNFGLEQDDENQLDQIKSVYDGKGTSLAKLEYLFRIEHCFYLIQSGIITLSKSKEILEVV